MNLISEKRVDTATAGSDRVIRTTLSLRATCYVSYVHKADGRIAGVSRIDRQKGINTRSRLLLPLRSPRISSLRPSTGRDSAYVCVHEFVKISVKMIHDI